MKITINGQETDPDSINIIPYEGSGRTLTALGKKGVFVIVRGLGIDDAKGCRVFLCGQKAGTKWAVSVKNGTYRAICL